MKGKGTKNSVHYWKFKSWISREKRDEPEPLLLGRLRRRLPAHPAYPQNFHGAQFANPRTAMPRQPSKRRNERRASLPHISHLKRPASQKERSVFQLSIFRGELLFLGRLLNMSHLWSIQVSKYNMFNTGGWWWCIVCFSWYTWATKFGEAIEMYKALQIAKETIVVQHEETPPTTMTPATFATTFCIWTSNEFSARCLHV